MDEVELASLAQNYLNKLEYDIDENTDKVIHNNTISYRKILSVQSNNNINYLSISNIDFYIDESQVLINDNTSRYIFKDFEDFNRNNDSKLTEFDINTEISFTRLDDKVIRTSRTKCKSFYNTQSLYNHDETRIENIKVDKNYKLTDGYPTKKHVKIKEKE